DCAIRLKLVRLFAAEKARGQRQRVYQLRRWNGEAPRHQWKERALIDEHVEAARPDLSSRRIAAHGKVVREHRLHVGREERRVPSESVADHAIEEYSNLIIRLLPDEHRFGKRQCAEVHLEARVDASARDDRWNATAASGLMHDDVDRPRSRHAGPEPRLEWRNCECAD